MVKKFTARCDFSGEKRPITLYVGDPAQGSHPLAFQSKWLRQNRSGTIPNDIMDAFGKIAEIAEKHRVAFEDLCSYVIDELNASENFIGDFSQASEFSAKAIEQNQNDETEDDEGDDRFTKKAENELEENKLVDQISNDLQEAQTEDEFEQEQKEDIEDYIDNHESIYLDSNYNKKPKKFKEAPIADDGLQPALKHRRDNPIFNANAPSLKKKQEASQNAAKKTTNEVKIDFTPKTSSPFYQSSPTPSRQEPTQKEDIKKDIKMNKVEPIAKNNQTINPPK